MSRNANKGTTKRFMRAIFVCVPAHIPVPHIMTLLILRIYLHCWFVFLWSLFGPVFLEMMISFPSVNICRSLTSLSASCYFEPSLCILIYKHQACLGSTQCATNTCFFFFMLVNRIFVKHNLYKRAISNPWLILIP